MIITCNKLSVCIYFYEVNYELNMTSHIQRARMLAKKVGHICDFKWKILHCVLVTSAMTSTWQQLVTLLFLLLLLLIYCHSKSLSFPFAQRARKLAAVSHICEFKWKILHCTALCTCSECNDKPVATVGDPAPFAHERRDFLKRSHVPIGTWILTCLVGYEIPWLCRLAYVA